MRDGGTGRRWTRIFRPDPRPEVDEELSFHLEQRARDYMARGMDEDAARQAARDRMGDLSPVRSECVELLTAERRAEARRDWMYFSWLDFKLGFRMLLRYPGLTLVGGLAMAFAIWVGAGGFEFIQQMVNPRIPLEQGERIVGLRNWDVSRSGADHRVLHDFVTWRSELRTVEEIGAFRLLQRNLITADGVAEPVKVAEVSASMFPLTRVAPIAGRTLASEDEVPGAAAVAVIGERVAETRFGTAAEAIGKTVQLGSTRVTIVGVMPGRFEFPLAQNTWVPLRLNPLEHARGQAPPVRVFGRLADGTSMDAARAELAALGARTTAEHPDTHEHLRAQVIPYTQLFYQFSGVELAMLMSVNLFLILLLALVCANVALLMFARAATRESEIVVRSALGASRTRIVTQLFAEALVLGALAAGIGLSAAGFGLRWLLSIARVEMPDLPFWFSPSLSPTTIAYALGLTLLAAAIAGVLPALKVTRGLQERLRQAAVGSGLQFGGLWTAVIVTQVALTVAFPVVTFYTQLEAGDVNELQPGFAEQEYLGARIEFDREAPGAAIDTTQASFLARFARTTEELERHIETLPGVTAVTFAERLPRSYHPHRRVEVEGAPFSEDSVLGYRVSSSAIAPDYLETIDIPVHTGRGFGAGDYQDGATNVIVNQSFVDRVLAGRNPIGKRLRYIYFEEGESPLPPEERGPWYEIVGVVRDMGMAEVADPKIAGVYHPLTEDNGYPVEVLVHVNGDVRALGQRLRTVAAAVNPGLRLYDVMPLSERSNGDLEFIAFWFKLSIILSACALGLSLAAIYAVMAFTVARRTREIGIRIALGANPRRLIAAVLRRPILQVTLGIIGGAGLVALFVRAASGTMSLTQVGVIGAYAVTMMGVCMLACVVPTRRALGVQPTEALRAEE